MQKVVFDQIIEHQIDRCVSVLVSKATGYAPAGDKLHNFRTAAELQGGLMKQALGGMMAKHTVSIYDMIASNDAFDNDIWDEKITDHINYLLLLRAVVQDEQSDSNQPQLNFHSEELDDRTVFMPAIQPDF